MVTRANYFSPEMSRKYCGSSQFKNFLKCPAMAMAVIDGKWQEEQSIALLVGSYVDAHFEGVLPEFCKEHPEIYCKGGAKRAEIQQADKIISRVSRDELFMRYMSGEKQAIKTGEIGGVPFKIRMDSYHEGKAIVDLKVIKSFEPIFNAEKGVDEDFIRYWGYDYQAAIYQAVEGNRLPFYLCVATKEKHTDYAVIRIPQDWIDAARFTIDHEIGIIQAIKRGEIPAHRCEKCAYCRETKKLSRVVSAEEFFERNVKEN